MEKTLSHNPERLWDSCVLVLVDDETIREVHQRFLDQEDSTDVITFTYPPMPPANSGYQGEIIVNIEQALREGKKRDRLDDELALYIAHGCNHLNGSNDDTPARKLAMRRRERQWLSEAKKHKLLDDLWDCS